MAAEEEDEDIWDSWEDVADSGELERRMEEREKQVREKDQKASSTSKKLQETKTGSPVLMQEDTNRTLYKPQLRILKRPDSGGTDNGNNRESSKDKPVHKTLAERQAQYAEARARILGTASDENNDSEKDGIPQTIQLEQKLPENVIRLPRGPEHDASKGFQAAR
ncbi:SUZ domain-containing protein 1-like [Orbicella faveolata]|uniref:SUZ domain-containing protein 1-like n=1 Tax=Orbicella faveolata TaxID=48498 RepID=UPI0009E64462|nr:SUZ domain-containing protein 1-like [Orbicella faveolata]